jgi:hypothetical protein
MTFARYFDCAGAAGVNSGCANVSGWFTVPV